MWFLCLKGVQVLEHLGQGQHVGILLIHIEKVHGVARLVAVENALLHHDHTKPIGATLDYTGTYAPAGAFTTGNDGIDAMVVQMPD